MIWLGQRLGSVNYYGCVQILRAERTVALFRNITIISMELKFRNKLVDSAEYNSVVPLKNLLNLQDSVPDSWDTPFTRALRALAGSEALQNPIVEAEQS